MTRPTFATLGGVPFATKQQLIAYLRQAMATANLGQPLAPAMQAVLTGLLQRHPRMDEKIGPGIRHFEVREHYWQGRYKQRGFYVVRVDGRALDFSFYMCLKPANINLELLDITEAAREAIADSVTGYRMEYFARRERAKCETSGEWLSHGQAHVDHADPWPFRRILKEWLAERDGRPATVHTDDMRTHFADPHVEADFRHFHDQRAVLRVVKKEINLARRSTGTWPLTPTAGQP